MPFLMANRNDLIFYFSWSYRKFNYEIFSFNRQFSAYFCNIYRWHYWIEALCYFVVFQIIIWNVGVFFRIDEIYSGPIRRFRLKAKGNRWRSLANISPLQIAKRPEMHNKLLRDLLTINSSANHSLMWINVCSNFHLNQ